MTRQTLVSAKEAPPAGRCLVCIKPMGRDEPRWAVHFRGADYAVCCSSCVQVFNRSPQPFLDQP